MINFRYKKNKKGDGVKIIILRYLRYVDGGGGYKKLTKTSTYIF